MMNICRFLTPILVVLLLGGAAAAQDPAPRAPQPVAAATERGLKCRVPLTGGGSAAYALAPLTGQTRSRRGTTRSNGGAGLGEHLALSLQPTRLRTPSQPGRRLGRGDVVLSVPLNDRIDLRTGVRVDYDSSPQEQRFEAEAIPTVGVGFEF